MRSDQLPIRIYIVGEKSGDPSDWACMGEWAIVAARSPEEALGICGNWKDKVAELAPLEPCLIHRWEDGGNDE